MILFYYIAGLCILVIFYLYLNKRRNYWKNKNVPHRKPLIFFGHFLDFFIRPQFSGNYFRQLYRDFQSPYVGFLAFTQPVLLIKDLDIVKRVLIRDFKSFQDRLLVVDESVDPFLANALVGVKGEKWRILRNKLSPVFTSGKIKLMLALMKTCGKDLVEYVEKNTNKSLEVKSTVAKYTTDLISSCAFGINANSFESEESEFREAGKKLLNPSFLRSIQALTYFMVPICVKLFRYPFLNRSASIFLRGAFKETITKRIGSKAVRNDLIDLLIDMQKKGNNTEFQFDDDKLVAQAIIFFGAGQETTSQVIAFTIHELCIHQNIQEMLRKEIRDCISKHGDLTYEAIQDMKYLHMVVSESLRKYPLVPVLQRVCLENYTIPETGLVIEKDTIIIMSPYSFHWDSKYFPNPELFDPERFNEANKKNIAPYSYLPFGDGPRNCIGERFGQLSAKLGIIYLVKNFQIKRNILTQEPLVFTASGSANASGGIQVTFTKL